MSDGEKVFEKILKKTLWIWLPFAVFAKLLREMINKRKNK